MKVALMIPLVIGLLLHKWMINKDTTTIEHHQQYFTIQGEERHHNEESLQQQLRQDRFTSENSQPISKKGTSTASTASTDATDSTTTATTTYPTYVTVVIPSVVNPKGRSKRLNSIASTWGPSTKAIFIIHSSDEYDEPIAQKNRQANQFPQTLIVPESVATVDEGVPRLQYVIQQVVETYNPDFAFFVNDHTFVIPEHACDFIQQYKPDEHLYVGHALIGGNDKLSFNSGASGYFLSRKTMNELISSWEDEESIYSGKGASKWFQGNPGLITAKCMKDTMNLLPLDTRDDNGRHVFHPYGLVRTVMGKFDKWFVNKHQNLDLIFGKDSRFSHLPRQDKNCCASNTISFHYVEYLESIALYQTLKSLQNNTITTDLSLKQFMTKNWPTNPGGYSHKLPGSNDEIWEEILHVVKDIAPLTDSIYSRCS